MKTKKLQKGYERINGTTIPRNYYDYVIPKYAIIWKNKRIQQEQRQKKVFKKIKKYNKKVKKLGKETFEMRKERYKITDNARKVFKTKDSKKIVKAMFKRGTDIEMNFEGFLAKQINKHLRTIREKTKDKGIPNNVCEILKRTGSVDTYYIDGQKGTLTFQINTIDEKLTNIAYDYYREYDYSWDDKSNQIRSNL